MNELQTDNHTSHVRREFSFKLMKQQLNAAFVARVGRPYRLYPKASDFRLRQFFSL